MARRTPGRLLRVVPPTTTCPVPVAPGRDRDRYGDLSDRRLAAILAAEDTAEEHGLSPHTRSTCYVHRCWIHQCVTDPLHVLMVTGHRWCRRCDCPVEVDVDDSDPGSVGLYCPGCGQPPDSTANRQVLYACRTSLAAMHGGASTTLYQVPDR